LDELVPEFLLPDESIVKMEWGWRVTLHQGLRRGCLVLTEERLFFLRLAPDERTLELDPDASWRLEEASDAHMERAEAPIRRPQGGSRTGGAEIDLVVAGERFRLPDASGFCTSVKKAKHAAASAEGPRAGSNAEHVVTREVIRVIVKVPCRYCGHLIPNTAARCDACGAPVRI
jgi:hypothetical protein